ncbi:hypothetical protein M406DRAFT_320160 [Cryphonectria parasitica EP155]|uniref:Large ribosomal subunit protein mL67 n=1 Tax=Cryphonectria parasitica (strain ATCC 38755 / EP155) TaxID=660469 RepID=A0A9P4YBL6_CRYP1|nr:uncharacterized protein M406DRAFT_320160 [Cryphonectria parasitica EP155]KAF3770050.1 hypothetical protein M406DRAFT_320160 [Cryphonectria parasitica EP155]
MNTSSPTSLVGILDSLSIGVSRTSIRQAHSKTKFRRKKYHLAGFGRGHGENIYVFNHIENGMVIYSHEPRLQRDSQKYLSQIPFTVKKQKPPVIREDYWQPLCMIRFGSGQGVVGRSVFQKLREFRALHELEWGWQAKEFQKLSRRDRGEKIHNQKPNTVADIAAVLAGAGRGNLMWTTEPAKAIEGEVDAAQGAEAELATIDSQAAQESALEDDAQASSTAPPSETAAPNKASKKHSKRVEPSKRLHKATIYWSNDADLFWARKWSQNVEHEVGLPDGVKVWNWRTKEILGQAEEAPEEQSAEGDKSIDSTAEAGAGNEDGKEGEAVEKQEPVEQKKGWFGWLGGKSINPGQDARA